MLRAGGSKQKPGAGSTEPQGQTGARLTGWQGGTRMRARMAILCLHGKCSEVGDLTQLQKECVGRVVG